ncbi:baseplate J/gp47 family protein [Asaia astilbis]|uniref:baseplate J/gp47 family protein n=1 Tax=Asaia astilbis TaxID=610244 RepID=UPI00068493DD|nr:baseplate J/gp47 family protein [Asaia astilbis]
MQVTSPSPGNVTVFILSSQGDGTAPADLVETVSNAITPDSVRPLTDNVTVQSATILPFAISAVLTLYPGPDASVVVAAAQAAAQAYADRVHKIGYTVATSGLYAALQQTGVEKVVLDGWAGDITAAQDQAPYCTGIAVTTAAETNV